MEGLRKKTNYITTCYYNPYDHSALGAYYTYRIEWTIREFRGLKARPNLKHSLKTAFLEQHQ